VRPEWRNRSLEVNLYGVDRDELVLRPVCAMLHLSNGHFRGYAKDVRGLWAQNHLLVLPSRYEGLPRAVVESMWCGRPTVVTDVGGNAELYLDNQNGFVAERREEWAQLGQAARHRVETQIPKDPIGLFCDRLIACAARSNDAARGSFVPAHR
jgi:glycosyltransferase involved in cell wall biosynthesis